MTILHFGSKYRADNVYYRTLEGM